MPNSRPSWDLALQELQSTVDEEVQRLPAKYRAPFVLCCLENKSKAEAALELGWKVGTVSSRLNQARRRLQQRLTRRGVTLSAVLGAAALSQRAGAAALPALLVHNTVQAALLYAAGKTATGGAVSAGAPALAEGVIQAMFITKTKIATLLFVAAAALVAGTGALTHATFAALEPDSQQTEAAMLPDDGKETANRDEPRLESARSDEKAVPSIGGRVLGPDGKPLAGAKLYVNPHLSEREPPVLATTNAAGRFQFKVPSSLLADPKTGLPSYRMHVVATAVGRGPGAVSVGEGEAADELEVRLVKDDVPLVGRILDLEGHPVVGAKVSIRSVRAVKDGDLTRLLRDLQGGMSFPWDIGYLQDVLSGPVPGQPRSVTTDEGGRFRITGVGRERLVDLGFEGPPCVFVEPIIVMTRPAEPVSHSRQNFTVYGAEFRILGKPARSISGTVRDKGTGKPLAGIRVSHWLGTVSDANGRFELQGLAKSASYWLSATPTKGEPYFASTFHIPDTDGLGPLTANLEMVQGIPCRGRVTDKATGKPVRGHVSYHPIWGNPDAKELGGAGRFGSLSDAVVATDGSFTCRVLPGPGCVAFRTESEQFVSACVDPSAFFKGQAINPGDKDYLIIDLGGSGGPLPQDTFQAIVLINPPKDEAAIMRDLTVEPAVRVTGMVLGPDDKPLTGVRVQGLPEPILKTGQFELRGNNPGRPRRLYFYHDTQRLVGTMLVKGNEKEKLTVRLEPWGTVTGRLISRDGEPFASRGLFSASRDPRVVSLPGHYQTGKDGSFRIEALVPGAKYTFYFTKPAPPAGAAEGYLFQGLSVKPGETRDLGAFQGKSFRNN